MLHKDMYLFLFFFFCLSITRSTYNPRPCAWI